MIEVKYDFILVIMKKLTKYIILILYYKLSITEQLAYVFIKEVISRHKLPKEILLDRDKLFILKF